MKHILIIEDDKGIAELEKDYLEANGFAVSIEVDGIKGQEQALRQPFDLILLDIMLPGQDGFQICRHIREHKNIPVLLVSAKQEDIDKIRGLGLGADDYIVKPFSLTSSSPASRPTWPAMQADGPGDVEERPPVRRPGNRRVGATGFHRRQGNSAGQ